MELRKRHHWLWEMKGANDEGSEYSAGVKQRKGRTARMGNGQRIGVKLKNQAYRLGTAELEEGQSSHEEMKRGFQ